MAANSQKLGINIDTVDNSAVLDLSSDDSGILIPRLNSTQRMGIDVSQSPEGLLIYNTTDECLQIYVDNEWNNVFCKDCQITFTTQPVNKSLCEGDNHEIYVDVSGTVLSYQWQKDNVNITGATNRVFSISSISSSDAGDYKCVVVGSCNTITSSIGTIALHSEGISTQPSDVTAEAADNVTFNVVATGSSLSYQWEESQDSGNTWSNVSNGGLFSGTTTNSLSITGITSGMNGYQYRCEVSGNCTNISSAGTLHIWSCGSSISDIDGNSYVTVLIGTQCWMAENLEVTQYSDGTAIPEITSASSWSSLTTSSKAFCYYDYDAINKPSYGALYTWAGAMNGTTGSTANPSGIQGACPTGWHIPSHNEWATLELFLGMSSSVVNSVGYRGTDQGSQMAGNMALWSSGNLENDGDFGSAALDLIPGGYVFDFNGASSGVQNDAMYWTTSTYDSSKSYARYLTYNRTDISNNPAPKGRGASVRCIKD